MPACKYNVTEDWKKTLPNQGRWLKAERVTSTVDHMKFEKKRDVPGPGQYKEGNIPGTFGFGGKKLRSDAREEKHIPEIWQAQWHGE